jgi:hypothetical protein
LEILLICFVIFIYTLSRKINKSSNTNNKKSDLTSNKVQKQSIAKKKYKKRKYNPGQKKSKPKIDPMSRVDPIEWNKFTVCDVCGSENKGSIVRCHPQ